MNSPLVIFDFNRTVYDPDSGRLMPGANNVLRSLTAAGCRLALVSRGGPGRRNLVSRLGIESKFDQVKICRRKDTGLFRSVINGQSSRVYVIGDRIREEIRIGNQLGARTIWLKRGKFATEHPRSADEEPWQTITRLTQVITHIN